MAKIRIMGKFLADLEIIYIVGLRHPRRTFKGEAKASPLLQRAVLGALAVESLKLTVICLATSAVA